ncbi:hypothetical protein ACLOJK_024504 [Asimina triloba]
MALSAPALCFTFVSHVLAAFSAVLVLVWTIHFRGGLAFQATNKNLIFNSCKMRNGALEIEMPLPCLWLKEGKRLLPFGLLVPAKPAKEGQLQFFCMGVYNNWADVIDRLDLMPLHPVLMLIGFIILGGEAIISYKAYPLTKEVKKLIHLILHAIALVLGAFGIYFAFKYHNESGIVNLYSLHSWLGLGVICFYHNSSTWVIQTTFLMIASFKCQWVFGFVVFFFPGAPQSVRSNALPWHVVFGLFIFVLALATAELGFLEKLTFLENSGLYKYGPEAYLVNFTGIVVAFFGAFVVLAAISPAQPDNSYDYASIPEN